MRKFPTLRKAEVDFKSMTTFFILVIATVIVLALFISFQVYTNNAAKKSLCALDDVTTQIKKSASTNDKLANILATFGGGSYAFNCPANFAYIQYEGSNSLTKSLSTVDKKNAADLGYTLDTKEQVARFRLDQAMTKELDSCYQKIGNREIFDEFYKLSVSQLDAVAKTNKVIRDQQTNTLWQIIHLSNVAPPRFCAVCSKIVFDDQTQLNLIEQNFNRQLFTKMLEKKTSLSGYAGTLLDGLTKITTGPKSITEDPLYTKYSTQKTQAVVYIKRYPYKATYGETATKAAFATAVIAIVAIPLGIVAIPASVGGLILTTSVFTGTGAAAAYAQDTLAEAITSQPIETYAIVPYGELSTYCDILANTYDDKLPK